MKILVAIVVLLLSTSCSYYYDHQEQVSRRKMCYMHCEQRWNHCTQICDEDANRCHAKNDTTAAAHVVRYQQQQAVKGQIIIAALQSFRDPLACRKTSCDCAQDKSMCKEACRGTIYKRLQSVM